MKKIASLFLLMVVSLSCSEDIKHNDPAIEGLKDDIRWRASLIYAELLPNQNLRIIGKVGDQTLTMTTTNKIPMVYTLGIDTAVTAVFEDSGDNLEYATGMNVGGDGIIKIEKFDEIKMTVTGTFRFNAVNTSTTSDAPHVVNFQYGNFYKVPVIPAL